MVRQKTTVSTPAPAAPPTGWAGSPLHALLPLTVGRLGMYLSQLGDLLEAGVTMYDAMGQLAAYSYDWRLRRMSREIAQGAARGLSVHEQLGRYPQLTPAHVRGMLLVGERAGTLPAMCHEMAEELRQQQGVRWKYAIGQLLYGVFFVVALLIFGITRIIAPEGANWGAYLQYLRTVALPCLLGFVVLWNLVKVIGAIPALSGPVHRLLYALPGSRQLIGRSAMIRLLGSLDGLLKAGLELPEALGLAAEATGNSVVSRRLAQAAVRLRNGGDLQRVLQDTKVIPREVIDSVMIAHRAGTYERSLAALRANWRQARGRATTLLGFAAYGLMLVLSAGVVLFVLYHGYTEYFNALFRIFDER